MLDQELQEALNHQLNDEFYSSYLYLSMSAYCDQNHLPGIAHWMHIQSKEEIDHAMRLYSLLTDHNATVILETILKPPSIFSSLLEMVEQANDHEKMISQKIKVLFELAIQKKSYALQNQLQWFLVEQVEEEKNADMLVQRVKMVQNNTAALLMLDRELADRKDPE